MLTPGRASISGRLGAVMLALAVLSSCGSDAKQVAGDGALNGNGSPNMNGSFRLSQQSVEFSGCPGMADASSTDMGGTIPGKGALLSLIPPYLKIVVAPDGTTAATYKCTGDTDASCETAGLPASIGQNTHTVFADESITWKLPVPQELQDAGIYCSLVIDVQSSLTFVNSNDAAGLWEISGQAVEARHLLDCGQVIPEWADYCKAMVTLTAARTVP